MMEALTAFDAVAIVLVILSTLMALARGFLRELATLGAFIAALAAAYYARIFLRQPLFDLLPDGLPEWTPDAVLFIGFFLIVYVAVAWLGAGLSKSIQGVDGVGLIDRLAGGVFGFARGALVLVFAVYLMNLFLDKDQVPQFIAKARTYPLIAAGADYLKERAPELASRSLKPVPLDGSAPEE